jgi:hypothetical protein
VSLNGFLPQNKSEKPKYCSDCFHFRYSRGLLGYYTCTRNNALRQACGKEKVKEKQGEGEKQWANST